MDELVEWLRARLDEDEQIARAAMATVGPVLGAGDWRYAASLGDEGGKYWSVTTTPPTDSVPTVELVGSGVSGGGVHEEALAVHIARHDPARVLREIDAKRQIVNEHDTEGWKIGDHVHDCQWTERPCRTLRLLALPYADHPAYREEWRP